MTKPTPTYPRVRWRDSLIVRVIVLCAVLLLCLLGSVYEISRHYFGEVVREMEAQTQDIANRITFHLEEHAGASLTDVEHDVQQLYPGTVIKLDDTRSDSTEFVPFTVEKTASGELVKTGRLLLEVPGQNIMLTARVSLAPQTELVRAFKNKYLALLTAVFIIALGFMIYFIARILRPLSDLADSCARIGSGQTGNGQLQKLSGHKTSGEIQSLEYTFNNMVASLQEKEKIEANLRQAQRLSAIGNMAAGVAHDIRNPLNAIKLLSSHAIDTLNGSDNSGETVRHLQTIRNEVNRLEEIVSGFLSLAKERELQPEPTKIDVILGECARLVRKDAEDRGIRLIAEFRAGDTSLSVDPRQLTRAILNILINALEVCPRGGRVRLFSRVTDQSCEIEVRDDGPGMPKEVAERAFEPYFTTKDTGTGLGLSITRGIVEEHGGNVSLSCAEGQGCQVLISLPLETAQK